MGSSDLKATDLKRALSSAIEREVKAEYERRWEGEVKARLDPLRALSNETYAESRRVLDGRKGIMTKAQYKLILACLHPDNSASVEKRAEAFDLFNRLEILFLNEADSPTTTLPSWEELQNRRRAQGRRRRGNGS